MVLENRTRKRRAARRRYILPGAVVHIGSRTLRGQHWLSVGDKDAHFVPRCAGLLIRAAKRYQVEVIAVVMMSNHVHLLVRAQRPRSISLFMQYFKAGVTVLVHSYHARAAPDADGKRPARGSIWDGPFKSTNLLDAAAEAHRLRYLIAHGVKEGLVARPQDWPGLNCVDALLSGTSLRGMVVDREALKTARRTNPEAEPTDHLVPVELKLARLSAWRRSAGWRAHCRAVVEDVVAEHAGRPVRGLDFVLETPFRFTPRVVKYSRCPCFEARGEGGRETERMAYAARREGIEAGVAAVALLAESGRHAEGLELPPPLQWTALLSQMVSGTVLDPAAA